jgi:hypothetical protein
MIPINDDDTEEEILEKVREYMKVCSKEQLEKIINDLTTVNDTLIATMDEGWGDEGGYVVLAILHLINTQEVVEMLIDIAKTALEKKA